MEISFLDLLLRSNSIIVNDIKYSLYEIVNDRIYANTECIFDFGGYFIQSIKNKGNQWVIIKFINDSEHKIEIKIVF
jgi:hypothetical protein